MPGVSWSRRQPTDWLASNGRWYSSSTYPKGWSTTALPPAPGHGGIGSILRRFEEKEPIDGGSASVSSSKSSSTEGDAPSGPGRSASSMSGRPPGSGAASAPQPPSSSMVPTGRGVADASVTEVSPERAGSTSISSASTSRAALSGGATPPPPGRRSPDSAPSAPPAPTSKATTSPIPPPSPSTQPFEVVAGDLGRVLGSAKRRIERAINDSAES